MPFICSVTQLIVFWLCILMECFIFLKFVRCDLHFSLFFCILMLVFFWVESLRLHVSIWLILLFFFHLIVIIIVQTVQICSIQFIVFSFHCDTKSRTSVWRRLTNYQVFHHTAYSIWYRTSFNPVYCFSFLINVLTD